MIDYKQPKPMKWHVLVGRRNLDVKQWLSSAGIATYDALCTWCDANRVEHPTREQVAGMFEARAPKQPRQPQPEPEPAAPAATPQPEEPVELKPRKSKRSASSAEPDSGE